MLVVNPLIDAVCCGFCFGYEIYGDILEQINQAVRHLIV
jgi:hypothetical protein